MTTDGMPRQAIAAGLTITLLAGISMLRVPAGSAAWVMSVLSLAAGALLTSCGALLLLLTRRSPDRTRKTNFGSSWFVKNSIKA